MYPNPMLQQQMAQLEQEYAQRKANIMQNFYDQQQSGSWGRQSAQSTQQQTTSQNVDWIQVSGIEGAKNQIVQQGCTAWMMDNNQPYFYVKSVNKIGSPEFHAFFFQEVSESELNQQANQAPQPQIDPSQYVQRDEFERFKEQMEQITTTVKKQPVKANKGVEDNG